MGAAPNVVANPFEIDCGPVEISERSVESHGDAGEAVDQCSVKVENKKRKTLHRESVAQAEDLFVGPIGRCLIGSLHGGHHRSRNAD